MRLLEHAYRHNQQLIDSAREDEAERDKNTLNETMRKVGYAYDFVSSKILDPLNLSFALKLASCIETIPHLLTPELRTKHAQLMDISLQLKSTVAKSFSQSFASRDKHGLTQAVQVFFNCESVADEV